MRPRKDHCCAEPFFTPAPQAGDVPCGYAPGRSAWLPPYLREVEALAAESQAAAGNQPQAETLQAKIISVYFFLHLGLLLLGRHSAAPVPAVFVWYRGRNH